MSEQTRKGCAWLAHKRFGGVGVHERWWRDPKDRMLAAAEVVAVAKCVRVSISTEAKKGPSIVITLAPKGASSTRKVKSIGTANLQGET